MQAVIVLFTFYSSFLIFFLYMYMDDYQSIFLVVMAVLFIYFSSG